MSKEFPQKRDSIDGGHVKTLQMKNRKMVSLRDYDSLFLKSPLNKDASRTFFRDDYREVAEITITLLGGTPPRGIHFLKPGAYHHARWMR